MYVCVCVCVQIVSGCSTSAPPAQALNWRLNHHAVSVNTWVNVYMQLGSHHLRPPGVKAREFEYPAYSCLEFIRVMQVGLGTVGAVALLVVPCRLQCRGYMKKGGSSEESIERCLNFFVCREWLAAYSPCTCRRDLSSSFDGFANPVHNRNQFLP